jgi:multidrug resistance efflux pump
MITIVMLAYAGLVVLAFKVIKLKVTPTSVVSAITLGVFVIGLIVVAWKMAAPMTPKMTLRRYVLQVVPDVREFVSEVNVVLDQKVKKGDLLFKIASDRFEDAVDQARAQLAGAKSTVEASTAAVTAAEEAVRRSEAETASAKAQLDTALAVQKGAAGAISKLQVTENKLGYRVAQADDVVAAANLTQARYALEAARYAVDIAQAGLNTAEFNLSRCSYTSPVDGQVVNWQITEGVPVARWRFTSVGTVMDSSDTAIIAIFPQNQLKNVKAGDEVEIAFKRMPGEIATGKVELVVKYTGEGQIAQSSMLPVAADIGSHGLLAVRIRLDDEELERTLPLGAAGTTAVYTSTGKPFHLISKITIRMKAWLNYLPI